MKRIIINADDYGMNKDCTDSIYAAFKEGLITDTTMAANGDDFDRAMSIIESDSIFAAAIGIHLNLTDGVPLTNEMRFTRFVTDGRFNRFFKNNNPSLIVLSKKEKVCIYNELDAQIKKMRKSGIKISHADSHHHVHTGLSIARIVFDVCKLNNINKIRLRKNVKRLDLSRKILYGYYNSLLRRNGFLTTDYFGDAGEYIKINEGVSEMMVHPGYIDGKICDVLTKRSLQDTINNLICIDDLKKINYHLL